MNFEQTTLWPRLLNLAERCDVLADRMPRQDMYTAASQLRRAANSVYANFAEGWGRDSPRDSAHFIVMARGSLNEVKAHLLFAQRRGRIPEDAARELFAEIEQLRIIFTRIRHNILKRLEPGER